MWLPFGESQSQKTKHEIDEKAQGPFTIFNKQPVFPIRRAGDVHVFVSMATKQCK